MLKKYTMLKKTIYPKSKLQTADFVKSYNSKSPEISWTSFPPKQRLTSSSRPQNKSISVHVIGQERKQKQMLSIFIGLFYSIFILKVCKITKVTRQIMGLRFKCVVVDNLIVPVGAAGFAAQSQGTSKHDTDESKHWHKGHAEHITVQLIQADLRLLLLVEWMRIWICSWSWGADRNGDGSILKRDEGGVSTITSNVINSLSL